MKLPRPLQISFVFWPLALGLTFFLLPSAFFLLSAPPAFAAVEPNTFYKNRYPDYVRNLESGTPNEVKDDRFNRRQTELTLLSIGDGILRPADKNTALSNLGSAIAYLTKKPPVQTKEYLAYMAGKAGFIDPAYAAERGGFDALQPIQKIWVATRNVAYLITSLTLVVIGFMIMLRKKIDAQTVIGVQQALPKLVITLLLITFSYAIAGFLIDMIYFLTYFGIKLLALPGSSIFSDAGTQAIKTITSKSMFQIGFDSIFKLGGSGSTGAAETAADAIGNLTQTLLSKHITEPGAAVVANILGQPIAFIIFAVAILFAVFKLFFALLMSYVQIILLAILGPLQLMLNALPGSDAFSKWFRNILANALAFPAAALMIVFAAAIMGQTGADWNIQSGIGFTDSTSGVNWIPPLVFGDGSGATNPVDAVMALLGIGVLLMTPKVVDMVKEWVQAPEFKYGSAIGEAVGFGWRGAKWAPSHVIGTGLGLRAEEAERMRQLEIEMYARGKKPKEVEAQKLLAQQAIREQRWGRLLGRLTGIGK